MIIIDKTLSNQRLIVTLSEHNPDDNNNLLFEVTNKVKNISYSLILPENTSTYKKRFDEFIIPTSSVLTWTEGRYMYMVWEVNPTTNAKIQELEIGLLEVKKVDENDFISIPTTDSEDDLYVYE